MSNLESKLAASNGWVRSEAGHLDAILTELGCTSRDEAGPGRCYRREGRVVLRVHPKLRHVALGFPDALRADVDALTGALRSQQRAAWLNYRPGVCDRDTLEVLIEKSVRAGTAKYGGVVTQSITAAAEPTESRPVRDDNADLTLILRALTAFREHQEQTGLPSPIKALRELIFFHWEGPRLPPGGKYSPQLPHSPAARLRRGSGQVGGLVYEHVLPISVLIRRMLDDVPADITTLRAALEASAARVIITKTEDDALSAAGMRSSVPSADDPWSRYRAIGLELSAFRPWQPDTTS